MMSQSLSHREKKIKIVYTLIILFFSLEYLGENWLSVYRCLIFPLLLIGCLYVYRLPKANSKYTGLILSTLFFLLYLAACQDLRGGNSLFPIFTIPLAIVIYGFNSLKDSIVVDYSKIVAWYSLPHIIAYFGNFANFDGGRFCGLHQDPNFCGIFLSLSAISCLFVVFRNNESYKTKIIYGILLAVTLFLLAMAASRGAILSFSVIIFYYLFKSGIHILWKLLIIGLLLFAYFELSEYIDSLPAYVSPDDSVFEYLMSRFKSDSFSDGSHRTYLWSMVIKRLVDNGSLFVPLGRQAAMVGLGNDYSHNTYLDFLIEIGIIPGVVFVLFIILALVKTGKKLKYYTMFEREYLICGYSLVIQLFFLSAMSQKIIWVSLFYIFSLSIYKNKNKICVIKK